MYSTLRCTPPYHSNVFPFTTASRQPNNEPKSTGPEQSAAIETEKGPSSTPETYQYVFIELLRSLNVSRAPLALRSLLAFERPFCKSRSLYPGQQTRLPHLISLIAKAIDTAPHTGWAVELSLSSRTIHIQALRPTQTKDGSPTIKS